MKDLKHYVFERVGREIVFRSHDSPQIEYMPSSDLQSGCMSRAITIFVILEKPGRSTTNQISHIDSYQG